MKTKRRMRVCLVSRILAVALIVCMMLGMTLTASAETANQNVTDAKNGVVQIQVWFNDEEVAAEAYLHSGTGFLINDNTVVTCQHVVNGFPDAWYVEWAKETNEILGGKRTAEDVKEKLELRVSIYRDVYVTATVTKASTEMDFAILSLNENMPSRAPLALRNSAELSQTENVFALGFPGDITSLSDHNYYDADDVTITSGNVNKVDAFTFQTVEGQTYNGVNCVESSALITGGNSGGPLVDENGAVVGINAAGNDTRNLAVGSEELIKVLDALGITYTDYSQSVPPEPDDPTINTADLEEAIADAKKLDAADYTEDSYADVEEALEDAEKALNAETQEDVDKATDALTEAMGDLEAAEVEPVVEEPKANNVVVYAIIGIVALLIIGAVVVLIIVLGKKKPAQPIQSAQPVQPVAKQVAPQPAPEVKQAAPVSNETTVLNQGAGETTVLSQGAGETTVLSQAVNGGVLVRSSNNEKITISTAEFTIGRERNKVDYCVGGNTNISRVHARFVVRNGATYIVDNNAANGTFVNGVKVRAGQEIELKKGDKIVLADEKFEFDK